MKIAVIAPSAQYLSLAGVRIRYKRIKSHLEAAGHSIDVLIISEIGKSTSLAHDSYLFSKCFDAQSLMVARAIKSAGKLVGIDMFDDYFSQSNDSRFVRYREWLRAIAPLCDYFLCSTPRMRDVMADLAPDRPAHVLNDPFEVFDAEQIASLTEVKMQRARQTRQIDALWFGVGDNPHFQVGLRDLAVYGDCLAQLVRRGYDVSLTILTNKRALDITGLRYIGQLGVSHVVEEWTQDREADLLAGCLLAFIPVNSQPFSIAKSLNRAVTALTGSCQVLSPGYPLYQPLEPFIYSNADSLADDIERSNLRLRKSRIKALDRALKVWGDPAREAADLIRFLGSVRNSVSPPGSDATPALLGVIHGKRSPAECHRGAQRLDHLSIASPFSASGPDYDIRYVFSDDGTEVQIAKSVLDRLASDAVKHLGQSRSHTAKNIMTLSLEKVVPGHPLAGYTQASGEQMSTRHAAYADIMHLVRDATERLFPGIELILSELDSPFSEVRGEREWVPPASLKLRSGFSA